MDLGNHGEEMPMPIATQFGAIHEAAAKLKLLATNGSQVDSTDVKTPAASTPAAAVVNPSPAPAAAAATSNTMSIMNATVTTPTTTTITTTPTTTPTTTTTTSSKRVRYRECLKNHAASIGGHALDGCGEFMPCGDDGTVDSLKCAACDCHRNFHRREVEGEPSCDCYRYKKRPLLLPNSRAGEAAGEEGGGGGVGGVSPYTPTQQSAPGAMMKKRFRTKFTPEQKEKMLNFADKLGWRIQKHDEAEVQQFVNEVGVKRHVLKVWMHNNKHTLGKKGS